MAVKYNYVSLTKPYSMNNHSTNIIHIAPTSAMVLYNVEQNMGEKP